MADIKPVAPRKSPVVQQVEFYFSDSNLPVDEFLLKKVSAHTRGFVRLSTICCFKRMRYLLDIPPAAKANDIPDDIIKKVAEELSVSRSLVVSKDGTKVRRKRALGDLWELQKSIDDRSLFCEPFPFDINQFMLMALFRPYGGIKSVRLLRDTADKEFNGRAFIEFVSKDVADEILDGVKPVRCWGVALEFQRKNEYLRRNPHLRTKPPSVSFEFGRPARGRDFGRGPGRGFASGRGGGRGRGAPRGFVSTVRGRGRGRRADLDSSRSQYRRGEPPRYSSRPPSRSLPRGDDGPIDRWQFGSTEDDARADDHGSKSERSYSRQDAVDFSRVLPGGPVTPETKGETASHTSALAARQLDFHDAPSSRRDNSDRKRSREDDYYSYRDSHDRRISKSARSSQRYDDHEYERHRESRYSPTRREHSERSRDAYQRSPTRSFREATARHSHHDRSCSSYRSDSGREESRQRGSGVVVKFSLCKESDFLRGLTADALESAFEKVSAAQCRLHFNQETLCGYIQLSDRRDAADLMSQRSRDGSLRLNLSHGTVKVFLKL